MRKCDACGSNNMSSVSSAYEGNYEECRDCGKRTSIPSYEELVRRVAELESENERKHKELIKVNGRNIDLHAKLNTLESENKALRLIANSHSMSELRRMKIMSGYVPGGEK